MLKGKITQEHIESLKKDYQGEGLYRFTTLDGKDDIVFRALTTALATEVQLMAERSEQEMSRVEVDTAIYERCVVWPILTVPEFKRLPVGIVPSVVRSIMEKSGFVGIDLNGNMTGPAITTVKVADPIVWDLPTQEDIEACRTKAGKLPLYKVKVGLYAFLVRPITRIDIETAATRVEQTNKICELVTLFPEKVDWQTMPLGIIESLYNQAQIISGAINTKVEVEEL